MRIGHSLHDGLAQDLGLALLRIRSLRQGTVKQLASADSETERVRDDFELVETALNDALRETREISADLHLPELEELDLPEVVVKAKADHERKTGSTVEMAQGFVPASAKLPVKIAVYRVLQEALMNSYRHAGGKEQRISVSFADDCIELGIADGGPGFDLARGEDQPGTRPGLGLRGMRERIEMLGGTLEIDSSVGGGTTIRARLPLEGETR
jgi:signal transduction histidine kinase